MNREQSHTKNHQGDDMYAHKNASVLFLMGAATLMDSKVCNHKNESIGRISEIMLDMFTGRVSYAVLSFDSFSHKGKKLFAIPWASLSLDTATKCFILDIEKGQLETSSGFDKSNWPNRADQVLARNTCSHYETSQR